MGIYCIGDIQGCDGALGRLLDEIGFSPSRDTAYLLGDLVNRGPDSLATLRRCRSQEGSLLALLGNHDLHLLAVAHGIRAASRRDTLQAVVQAPDGAGLVDWLRRQPLARQVENGESPFLALHAGVLPSWSTAEVLALAREVENALQGPDLQGFLSQMYGNEPPAWNPGLQGADRLRVVVNALTRLRFCTPEGAMDFSSSESAHEAPTGLIPWFDAPERQTAGTLIAFGHWSTLGGLNRADLLGMDTGCVWGGQLSAVRLGASPDDREFFQVQCPQAQAPG